MLTRLAMLAALPPALIETKVLDGYRVREMVDGGMGSIRFEGCGAPRSLLVSEVWIEDSDGVVVSAVLNLDDQGHPAEIDIWKMDCSPLLSPIRFLSSD